MKTNEGDKILLAVFGLFGTIVFLPIVILVDAIALRLLWGWFVVPVLHWPSLSLVQAAGISLIAGLLSHQYIPLPGDEKWRLLMFQFTSPMIVLAVGWVISKLL